MPSNPNKIMVVKSTEQRTNIQKSYGINYLSKKKQADMIKSVINEEIKDVPSKTYRINKNQ